MRMARLTSPFALTPSDLIALQGWLRMSTLEQCLAQRARILLLLTDGLTAKAVSEQLQVTPLTVYLDAGSTVQGRLHQRRRPEGSYPPICRGSQ